MGLGLPTFGVVVIAFRKHSVQKESLFSFLFTLDIFGNDRFFLIRMAGFEGLLLKFDYIDSFNEDTRHISELDEASFNPGFSSSGISCQQLRQNQYI